MSCGLDGEQKYFSGMFQQLFSSIFATKEDDTTNTNSINIDTISNEERGQDEI